MTFGTVWRGLRSGKSMSAVRLEAFFNNNTRVETHEATVSIEQWPSRRGRGGKVGSVVRWEWWAFLSGCCSDPLKQFIGTTAATATDEFSRITSGPTRSKRDCIDIFLYSQRRMFFVHKHLLIYF